MNAAYGLEVLAFGPHPDDVELFCGGLIARMSAQGYRTGIVDLTRGELASRGTPELRAQETAAATRTLGVTVRENLELPDGWLHPWAGFEGVDRRRESAAAQIASVLRRLRPELVVAPWERDRHPDHEAASALVTRGLFLAGLQNLETDPAAPPFTPRQVLFYPLRQLADPSVVIDVSDSYETKLAAIRCYASQVEPTAGAAATLVGSPLSMPSLDARDRFYGAQIGVAHGEPYVLREMVGLADPVDHFRRNTFARPLYFPVRR